MSFTEMVTLGEDKFVMEEGLPGSFVLSLSHLKCLLVMPSRGVGEPAVAWSLEFRGMGHSCAFWLGELTERRVWAEKRRGPGTEPSACH